MVGFTKTGYMKGNYWLKVDGTQFTELLTYDESANVPDVAYSTVEEYSGSNIQFIIFNVFLKGLLKSISVEHNMRSQ